MKKKKKKKSIRKENKTERLQFKERDKHEQEAK